MAKAKVLPLLEQLISIRDDLAIVKKEKMTVLPSPLETRGSIAEDFIDDLVNDLVEIITIFILRGESE